MACPAKDSFTSPGSSVVSFMETSISTGDRNWIRFGIIGAAGEEDWRSGPGGAAAGVGYAR